MGLQLAEVVQGIVPSSSVWRQKAACHLYHLAIPKGSLGDLLTLAEQLAAIRQTLKPSVRKKAVVTMAGDHGVTEEGVSAFPQEVTAQMVGNFVAGGASINILSEVAKSIVIVVDMGVAADLSELVQKGQIISYKVGHGTANMAKGPAMTRDQAIRAVEAGMDVASKLVAEGVDLLATGDMGIGNTTPSAAILTVLSGLPVDKATGRGTGLDDQGLKNKIQVIQRALAVNRPDPSDPIDVLAKVGGFEIGGITGLILGAAYYKIPVVVDGFISCAGAMLAKELAPASLDYMIAAHRSQEAGHMLMLQELGLTPLLDLNLRLGEGSGSALAMNVVEAAAQVIGKMLTFGDAGVTADVPRD